MASLRIIPPDESNPSLAKEEMKQEHRGANRIRRATRNSFRGIRDAWQLEEAFRHDVTISVVLLPNSFWLAQNFVEWLLLVIPLFLLIIVELLNSAVENTVDRIGEERHTLSGRAKDMGSAAVMFCLLLIAIVWLGMAWEKFHV